MFFLVKRLVFGAWLNVADSHYLLCLLFAVLIIITSALLLWRVWRFTIQPLLHSEEPQEVPYWIPFLGHARRFLKNQDQALSYGRHYFKNTRDPFAFTLGNEKLYILTSHEDVATAYKNTTTLDFGDVIKDLMVSFGVSRPGVERVFESNHGLTQWYNPHSKSFFNLKSDFYHTQLHPGQQFQIIQGRFLGLIDDAMRSENLAQDIMLASDTNTKNASLFRWCQQVFLRANLRTFLGERILQMDPHFVQDFLDFDDNSWMIFYRWPNAAVARNAKEKILTVLEAYLRLPKPERQGASWIIESMEDSQRQLGMKERDIAAVLMMFMWVVNTNTYKIAFWALAYIFHSPNLFSTLHAETAPSLKEDGSIDVAYLIAKSPHLDSLWLEVLRLMMAGSAIRTVLEPTRIGTKLLMPGYKVMSPFRQLHFDEEVFGKDAGQCNPDRFFHNKDLSRHPSYKPFGGGLTMCPGRFVARQEVFVFITLLLHRFHGRLAPGGQSFPRLDLETPTAGIISPKMGDDVVVSVGSKGPGT